MPYHLSLGALVADSGQPPNLPPVLLPASSINGAWSLHGHPISRWWEKAAPYLAKWVHEMSAGRHIKVYGGGELAPA
ncbi:MAG: hypothetical protein R2788_14460 [Saprospiraceae bacterium]